MTRPCCGSAFNGPHADRCPAMTTGQAPDWHALATRLAEALRGVERGHIQQGSAVCPDCGYSESEGHDADCKVGSVLAEYAAASGKTGGGSET